MLFRADSVRIHQILNVNKVASLSLRVPFVNHSGGDFRNSEIRTETVAEFENRQIWARGANFVPRLWIAQAGASSDARIVATGDDLPRHFFWGGYPCTDY